MNGVKDTARFAQVECLMDRYFRGSIAPIMNDTAKYIQHKQAQEMLDYSRSAAGILSMIGSSAMPMSDPYQTLKYTGEWNSKTTEDYVAMCKEKVLASETLQKDFAVIASEWRSAVIAEIGREQYDGHSEQIGCDLAYAYMEQRLGEQMIEKLIDERMPKSSAEYIIRKSAQSTLFGLPYELGKSPLTAEIEARGEKAYKPKAWEKGAGYAVGATIDAISLGGAGSLAAFAKLVGIDIAITAVAENVGKKESDAPSVEMCISQGVFGSEQNLFERFREEAKTMNIGDSPYLISVNEKLNNQLPLKAEGFQPWQVNLDWKEPLQKEERYKDAPLVVARGYEEQYLQDLEKKKSAKSVTQQNSKNEESANCNSVETVAESKKHIESEYERKQIQNAKTESITQNDIMPQSAEQQAVHSTQTNENGWKSLVNTLGLNGIGDVGRNLGYVFAMLPDVLLGALTGRTKQLNMKSSMLPLASILAGMFVKNPLLKTLLIGLGGMNLLNKAGHEVLPEKRYRQYADEPLNSRITNPVLQGNNLIADIDHIPCTIYLPDKVVEAHKNGSLPLNTLANAVLAKSDKMQSVAVQNYEADREESRVRTIGIQ